MAKKIGKYGFYKGVVLYPLCFVFLIWLVFLVDVSLNLNVAKYGIFPRTQDGLWGILFSPLIHGSISHLYNNTLPVFFLGMALLYFYPKISFKVFVLGYFLTGLLTWVIGRGAYHIGASGIIYMLASFIFFKGVFSKHFRLIAVSLIVVFFYGGLMWYVFPVDDQISWEGHLSGFLSGLLLAYLIKVPDLKKKVYKWEQPEYNASEDPFMKHFDENGEFIPESQMYQEENERESQWFSERLNVIYDYKKDKSKDKE